MIRTGRQNSTARGWSGRLDPRLVTSLCPLRQVRKDWQPPGKLCFAARTFSRPTGWTFSSSGVDLVPALQERSFWLPADSSRWPSPHEAGTQRGQAQGASDTPRPHPLSAFSPSPSPMGICSSLQFSLERHVLRSSLNAAFLESQKLKKFFKKIKDLTTSPVGHLDLLVS